MRVSVDLNKEELNQNQQQPLGCIAAGAVLQGFKSVCFLVESVMSDD